MLNRSAVVIGHEPAFYGWLLASGIPESTVAARRDLAEKSVYLIAACHFPEEIEEVVADIFAEIFQRELAAWQPDERLWPDAADFDLFTRWFTVEGFPLVADLGRGAVEEETA